MAPEFFLRGQLSTHADVYSFGVVLLELITGRRPVDIRRPAGEQHLVQWVSDGPRGMGRLGLGFRVYGGRGPISNQDEWKKTSGAQKCASRAIELMLISPFVVVAPPPTHTPFPYPLFAGPSVPRIQRPASNPRPQARQHGGRDAVRPPRCCCRPSVPADGAQAEARPELCGHLPGRRGCGRPSGEAHGETCRATCCVSVPAF